MARTDNLTNYLTDIATSIRDKKYQTLNISELISENPQKIQADTYDEFIQNNFHCHLSIEDMPYYSNNIIVNYVMNNNLLTDIDFSSENVQLNDPQAEYLFKNMQVDTITGLSNEYISSTNCTSFKGMFNGCQALQSLDISFDTGNAEIMENMFSNCSNLQNITLDINTENCIDFASMFNACEALETITGIENFDVSNGISFMNMFSECYALLRLDLSSWTPTNLVEARYMFANCSSLTFLDIRNFEFSSLDIYKIDSAFYGINTDCEIIVKNNTEKNWFVNNYPELQNVKTVAEYEASL